MKTILLVFIILINSIAFSQENLKKYWNYRKRLTDYFVKVGPNVGESIVAEKLNDVRERKFKIGDGIIDLGWYIGVLATEYALLEKYNQNTNNTLQELYYALLAYERLDSCENKPPWNLDSAKIDGFFNRRDVELFISHKYFSLDGRNTKLTKKNTWGTKLPGIPTYINEVDTFESSAKDKDIAMSQDQAVHLFMGLALVVKSFKNKEYIFTDLTGKSRSVNFSEWAKKITDLVITYIKKDAWIIKDPLGQKVNRGQNALANAYGFAKAGKYITGKNYQDFFSIEPFSLVIWNLQRLPNISQQYNTTMAMSLAAIGNSWQFPLGTANNLTIAGKLWDRELLYVPLFCYLHNKELNNQVFNKNKMKEIIDKAPENGTYFWGNEYINFSCCDSVYGNPGNGWAYVNRFRGTKKGQKFGADKANFNGLDYMLLFNLYFLLEEPYPYVNESRCVLNTRRDSLMPAVCKS